MRLAAALICLALLLPASAALADDLRPDGFGKACPDAPVVALIVPDAPGSSDAAVDVRDEVVEDGPSVDESTSLLMQLLGIIFGQDRLASWDSGPDSQ